MYNSFILPYFLYCIPLWGGSIKSDSDVIQKLHNKVLKIMFHVRRTADAWSYAKDIILPIQQLYKVEVANICFKHYRGQLPKQFSLDVMPTFAKNIHTIMTRHSKYHNYQFVTSNSLPLSNKSFTTQCIRVWNSVPNLLKLEADTYNMSIKTFSKKLKEHFLWINNNVIKNT